MQKELISIIVPVYNVEKYLNDFLNSLDCLNYPNFEVIFVNDGSTDNSQYILQEVCKKKENYKLINQNNSGSAAARNTGIANAKGTLLYMCDPDDVLHPNILSILENLINKNNYDISICSRSFVKENFRFCSAKYKNNYSIECFSGEDDILVQFMSFKKFLYVPWNKLYRMSILKKISNYPNVFDPNCYYGDDFDFCIKYITKCNTAIYTNYKLYYYRLRQGSIVHSSFNEKKLTIRLTEKFIDSLDNKKFLKSQPYLKARKCEGCAALLFLISKTNYDNKEVIKNLYNDFKKYLKYCFKCKKSIAPVKYFMWCKWPYFYFKLHKYLK